jgi:hypothetical protein
MSMRSQDQQTDQGGDATLIVGPPNSVGQDNPAFPSGKLDGLGGLQTYLTSQEFPAKAINNI